MAKIGILKVIGSSGNTYDFNVYPINQTFNSVAGVYCISHRYADAKGSQVHRVIYVGMTGDLRERFIDHHKDDCFKKRNANCISFHSDDSELSRRRKEQDLIQKFDPPCNG